MGWLADVALVELPPLERLPNGAADKHDRQDKPASENRSSTHQQRHEKQIALYRCGFGKQFEYDEKGSR